mmetsp:Transcript_13685/g.39244  ORF Transcript_13685/g.39244 Transcript_13685/m.39244 type:complete len:224 (+) Transcript_13685:260-931(+)
MPLYAVPLQRGLHALAREDRPLEQRGRHLAALERAAERLQVVAHRHERAGERLRAEPPHPLELRGVPLLRLGRGDAQGGHRRRVAALQQRERSGAERGRRHGRRGATLQQPPFLRLEILFVCQEAPHSALHVLRAAALLLDARRGAAAYRGSACCRVRVGRRRRRRGGGGGTHCTGSSHTTPTRFGEPGSSVRRRNTEELYRSLETHTIASYITTATKSDTSR